MKLRIGLIGCGSWPRLAHLPYLCQERNADTQLSAVADPGKSVKDIQSLLRSWNVSDSQVYQDFRDMIAQEQLDAVIISTPHRLHYEQASYCLLHRLHVLLDKPLATRTQDAKALVELASRQGRILAVANQRRYEDNYQYMRTQITSGALGEIRFIVWLFAHELFKDFETSFRADPDLSQGGVWIDSGHHVADTLLWLCDANALEVYAAMRGHERTPSDSYCAILARLNDGALASLAITRGAPAGSVQEEISIYGSQGSLFLRRFRVAAGGELATRDTSAGFIIQQTTGGEIVKEISGGEAKRWGPTEDFINCILRGGVPLSSGESNIRTVELIEAGYRAILGSLTDISLSNALVSDLGWSQARKTVVTPVGEQRYQLSGPVEDLHRREGNIEVHVAAICLRVNPETNALEVLLARRNPQKRIYPNLWEGGGGKVRPGENYHETVERELREELDVVVKVIAPLRTYEIDAPFLPQSKIPGTVFLCEVLDYVHGNTPKVDGTEMTEWRWQPVDQIDELDMIPNTYGDIQLASRLYSRIKEGTISFEL